METKNKQNVELTDKEQKLLKKTKIQLVKEFTEKDKKIEKELNEILTAHKKEIFNIKKHYIENDEKLKQDIIKKDTEIKKQKSIVPIINFIYFVIGLIIGILMIKLITFS